MAACMSSRIYLPLSVGKPIATAPVTSILAIIALNTITKLQCVQNCLARVVIRSPHFTCSMSLLKSFH